MTLVFLVVVGGEQEWESAGGDARVLGLPWLLSVENVPDIHRAEVSKALDPVLWKAQERRLHALMREQWCCKIIFLDYQKCSWHRKQGPPRTVNPNCIRFLTHLNILFTFSPDLLCEGYVLFDNIEKVTKILKFYSSDYIPSININSNPGET